MKIVEFDVEKHINVEQYIDNMTDTEKTIARIMYSDQLENDETDYDNFIDWLWDHAHSSLFESGEDK